MWFKGEFGAVQSKPLCSNRKQNNKVKKGSININQLLAI